ncbi:hypothetical protein QQ008_21055 [Fulvivirgaceae bacterium BMA10]|uniref:Macroglobulin domain-containing protein n=1 Tax=Splendidivirga corallicola TaxID=3051826 RepID=A0ABT8KUR1_9BACT|nr:hypothetical protein [Fulvivirgaceae bacterium BMA10]
MNYIKTHITFLYVGLIWIISATTYTHGWSQDLSELSDLTEDYLKRSPREKLFLHVSKPYFFTGENVWFKAYYFSSKEHQSIGLSKIAYVELINKVNEPVYQGKIKLDSTGGKGSFLIPITLESGEYKLRAYTNWMKNFDPALFFSQRVTIINPFKRLGLEAPADSSYHEFKLFPEGGHLVQGIKNRVAFKFTSFKGVGSPFKGVVIDDLADTVIHFQPFKFGMGHFLFTPSPERSYRVIVKDEAGRIYFHEVPRIWDSGFVMQTNQMTNIHKVVAAYAGNTSMNGKTVYLLGISQNKLLVRQEATVQSDSAVFTIKNSDLGIGINQFTLFDPNGQPISERLIFNYPENKLKINFAVSATSTSTREALAIDITTNDLLGETINSNLSLSVYRSNGDLDYDKGGFEANILLLSELKGNVESPDYYFSANNDSIKTAMDNLMLTQGWRRYPWKEILERNTPKHSHIAEFRNHLIQGTITNTSTNRPVSNALVYFSIPDSYTQFYVSKSNYNGRIIFETKDFYGESDIVLRADPSVAEPYKINLDNPFSDKYEAVDSTHFFVDKSNADFILDQSINMQIENAFKKNLAKIPQSRDTSNFYGIPDNSYNLDDFTRFTVMEEVMREYVYHVLVRKKDGKFIFKVTDIPNHKVFQQNPLVLLDGVPIFDIDKLMKLDPLRIRKVDVLKRKYFYGHRDCHGVLSFFTYKTDLAGFGFDDSTLLSNYQGLQEERTFYSPKYDTQARKTDKLPDFRNQLFWEPEIITDAAGKATVNFYTSDETGKYIVVVHGVGKGGLLGSKYQTIEVKAPQIK